MVFAVAMMCAIGINGISPSQIGLILSYTVGLTQLFGSEFESGLKSVNR